MHWRKIFIVFAASSFICLFANENLEILKAMSFLDDGKPEKSIKIYEKLYKNSGDTAYLKEALKISYANGEISLERLLKLGDAKLSADEDFWKIKTLNFLNKRDPKSAKDTAAKLLDINQSSKNHLLYGLVLSEANELDAAVSEYQKAYEIEKSDSNLLALAEFMDVKLGKRNEAVNYLEASRSINGCSEAVCLTLVEIYLQTQQFDKLAPLYEELYELTKDTSYLDKQIKILVFFKKFNEAASILEKYKYKEDELPDMYAADGKFDKAIAKIEELYEKNEDPSLKAKAAVYKYEKLGKAVDRKNLDEIIADFEASAVKSGDALYLNYYGYLLIDHDIDVKKGIKLVLLALEQEIDSPYYLDSLAWGYYKLKKCAKANKVMQQAMTDADFAQNQEAKEHEAAIKKCVAEQK